MAQRIHFGSLENAERVAGTGATIVEKIVGNPQSGMDLDQLEDLSKPKPDPKHQDDLLAEFERKKVAETLAVPTNDNKVRDRLRQLYEPMTLFGEGVLMINIAS